METPALLTPDSYYGNAVSLALRLVPVCQGHLLAPFPGWVICRLSESECETWSPQIKAQPLKMAHGERP